MQTKVNSHDHSDIIKDIAGASQTFYGGTKSSQKDKEVFNADPLAKRDTLMKEGDQTGIEITKNQPDDSLENEVSALSPSKQE